MKRFYLHIMVLIALSACKKSSTDAAVSADLLVSKPWKIAITDNNTATNPKSGTVIYNAWPACNNDDTFAFATNGTLTVNTGSSHCTTSEAAVTNYAYTIDKANNKITIDGTTFTLAELSETQLKYYAAVPATAGIQNIIYIYQH